MRITFLGTSDGYPEKERYCSCTVVTVGGKHYVIDAGVSLVSAMLKNDLDPASAAGVFITHMHGENSKSSSMAYTSFSSGFSASSASGG